VERKSVQISDVLADPEYTSGEAARLGGWRTILGVPLLREGIPIGLLVLHRATVRPFTDKQIELIETFAAQAVIAIENTRLLNELRQRTDDLSEALERQTSTSEVLRVISNSPGNLGPVFRAVLENAVRICGAKFGIMYHNDNGTFYPTAKCGVPTQVEEFLAKRGTFKPHAGTPLAKLLRTKQPVNIADITEQPAMALRASSFGGARSSITVPMLKENELVGAIVIYRQEARPFTDKQIELVQNFATQAVIAIENARLLNDLNELNRQLEQRVADQVSEIERMGKLRRFLPPQVADLIVASGTEKQLESHRQEITALFCDLRGFTGFSESADPEDVMALLREYHAAIGGIVNKYGGTLERYAGDGVMVVFNDPIPIDSPAIQAVRMAIDMRAAIGELTEKWRKLGHDIGFGIGIAHGFATLGTIGFEGRFDYAAIGTVSNVASRLCDEAKPGQILISPRVLMAVEKSVKVEPVGDFALKGIRRPLTAYNVLDSKTAD
jgi:adenylate cyclase